MTTPDAEGRCPNCGGTMIGDGYTTVRHCEFRDVSGECWEPDAGPLHCIEEPKREVVDPVVLVESGTGHYPSDPEPQFINPEPRRARLFNPVNLDFRAAELMVLAMGAGSNPWAPNPVMKLELRDMHTEMFGPLGSLLADGMSMMNPVRTMPMPEPFDAHLPKIDKRAAAEAKRARKAAKRNKENGHVVP